jgi:Ca-activated chloride channel family protein
VVKVAPEHTPDLFAGSPALLSVALRPEGGDLYIKGKTAKGPYAHWINVKPVEPGEGNGAIAALFAREQVEDLECDRAAGQGEVQTIDRFIEKLGLQFQISTRLTSWIAVSEKAMVDPTAPKRSETMPHNLPYGMSAEGVGLRRPQGMHANGYATGAPAPAGAAVAKRARLTQSLSLGGKADDAKSVVREEARSLEKTRTGSVGGDDADGEAPSEQPAPMMDEGYADELGEAPSGSFQVPEEPADAPVPARRESAVARRSTGAPEKKKEGGVFDKLGDLFRGKDKGEAQGAGGAPPAPPARPAAPPKMPAPAQPRSLRQRPPVKRMRAEVKLNKDGKLVLEIKVDAGGLEWAPKLIELHFADGTARPASIDLNQTTAACSASAGMVLTLSLEVGPLGAEPTEVWVNFDDGLLVLAIA